MKYVTVKVKETRQIRTGSLEEDGRVRLLYEGPLDEWIINGFPSASADKIIALDEAELLAPIPHPAQDVICLGMNFADHTVEAARFHPNMVRENYAVYFSKRVNEAVAPDGFIDSHPDVTKQVDYEAEVAVILKKDAFHVSREEVRDYIFGYTIVNDISAREIQNRHKQFYFGKSMDGFTPMGPCVVTADKFSYPPEIDVRCFVNGELRQDGNTRQWIYGIEDVVSELSSGMTLRAGTIISMGTPAGVGMGFQPPRYLKAGDEVICEAAGIGRLRNVVK